MSDDPIIEFIEEECLPNFTIIKEFNLSYHIKRTVEGGTIYFSNKNDHITFEVHINIRECVVDTIFYSEKLGNKRMSFKKYFTKTIPPNEVDINLNFPKINFKALYKMKKDMYKIHCGKYLVQCCGIYNDSIHTALNYHINN